MKKQRSNPAAWAIAACGVLAYPASPVHAALDESASSDLVLPLVMAGRERESTVTLSNASNTPVVVKVAYRGATGTPFEVIRAGEVACPDVRLDPLQWRAESLSTLCPALGTPDVENLGYLRLSTESDAWGRINAAQVTRSGLGTQFRVEAEPLGAFDIATPVVIGSIGGGPSAWVRHQPLRVHGLDGEVGQPGSPASQVARCWLAAHDDAKTVELSVVDATGVPQGMPVTVKLAPAEMQVVDIFDRAGLPLGHHENLSVEISTPATSGSAAFNRDVLVAGCGSVRPAKWTIDYRLARSWEPSDASRARWVYVDGGLNAGPYFVGVIISHSKVRPGDPDRKAALSVLVQPNDRIECRLHGTSQGSPSATQAPWQELQVKDASGAVVAGGSGAKRTGVFDTGPRDRPGGALAGPWRIEVSYDEDFIAANGRPPSQVGGWGVLCESATGISQPVLALDGGSATPADDF